MTMRVVYMGTPDFAVPALRALCMDPRVTVTLVVSQPDRVAGRGKKVQRTPVAAEADRHGIPTFQPESLRTDEAYATLAAENADLFVVAAYGQILQQRVLDLPTHGCVNLHASLLPRWRGAAPIQWSVAAGDAVTGVSLMRMEAGLDTGPVFAMATTMIRAQETAGELHDRLSSLSGALLLEHLPRLVDTTVVPEPQNNERAVYARMLRVDDRVLDLHQPANAVAWRINGMAPWPGTRIVIGDESMTLGRAAVSSWTTDPSTVPGTVIEATSKTGLHIACGQGTVVEILDIQRPSKKMIRAKEMLQGYAIAVGALATSPSSL